ncbi:MAG: FKBP-type peptidyl-prolyl cis-trans isomerase [Planctomycetota bacterium]|nr:FKBP-type peptidyl-prolyl cis-trans isomerase [Planctomycetota bacterium]
MFNKLITSCLLLSVISLTAIAQDESPEKPAPISEVIKDGSYAFGVNFMNNMKTQGVELNLDAFIKGVSDASSDKVGKTDQELQAAFLAFQQAIQKMAAEKASQAGANNKKEGEAFLAANAKKEGVKATDSGLQYKIIKSGKGATPKPTSKVTTHYEGKLINGTIFDSSYKRGAPATFGVNQVIPGWTEALQLMKEGDQWELYIPSNLAYGERGVGADIGPNSTLIFKIELIKVDD